MKIFDFFRKIFTPKSRRKAQEGEWERLVNARDGVDFEQEEERSRYVTDCLEQIAEASKELEMLQGEYGRVTAYLTDLEEATKKNVGGEIGGEWFCERERRCQYAEL